MKRLWGLKPLLFGLLLMLVVAAFLLTKISVFEINHAILVSHIKILNSDLLNFVILVTGLIALSLYVYIDFKSHTGPLLQVDPEYRYGLNNYLKKVLFPKLVYSRKKLLKSFCIASSMFVIVFVGLIFIVRGGVYAGSVDWQSHTKPPLNVTSGSALLRGVSNRPDRIIGSGFEWGQTDSYGEHVYFNKNEESMYGFDSQVGSFGTGPGEYDNSILLANDSSGNLYIADNSLRIQKFDIDGNYLLEWGGQGSNDDEFGSIADIAAGQDGFIYVTDQNQGSVKKFDSNGNFITKWGGRGEDDGEFDWVASIALDSEGYVYVADDSRQNIQKFDSNGNFITKWGGRGEDDGEFRLIDDIEVSSNGSIYVVDGESDTVQIFSADGTYLSRFNFSYVEHISIYDDHIYLSSSRSAMHGVEKLDMNGNFIARVIERGVGEDKVLFANEMSIDKNGYIYLATGSVTDGASSVRRFSHKAEHLLSGLSCGETYHYRLFTIYQDYSTVYGEDSEFTTLSECGAVTGVASSIGTGSASFSGSVNSVFGEDVLDFGFEYDLGEGYESNKLNLLTNQVVGRIGSQGTDDGQFNVVTDIAVDNDGNIFALDESNNSVQKFDSNGNFITKWGQEGTGDGEFGSVVSIAVDLTGSVYVTDSVLYRVQKFDSNGNFITKWGNYETLGTPHEIIAKDKIYVVDREFNKIHIYSPEGNLISEWGMDLSDNYTEARAIALDDLGNIYVSTIFPAEIYKYDSNGNLLFSVPFVDLGLSESAILTTMSIHDGILYVSESYDRKVHLFDLDVVHIDIWEFDYLSYSVEFSTDGLIHVSNPLGGYIERKTSQVLSVGLDHGVSGLMCGAEYRFRVFMETSNGMFYGDYQQFTTLDCGADLNVKTLPASNILTESARLYAVIPDVNSENKGFEYGLDETYGNNVDSGSMVQEGYGKIHSFGLAGYDEGKLECANDIATSSDGFVYVIDICGSKVSKFTREGQFIGEWGGVGSGNGEFNQPRGIAIDSNNNVYVSEYGNSRIQKFDSDGNYITMWGGSFGSGDGQFYSPYGMVVDDDNNIYVADTFNHRIQKFDSNGNFITKWGSQGAGDNEFRNPEGLAIGPDGYIYVADRDNGQIKVFDSSQNFISKTEAVFSRPRDVAVDANGNLFVTNEGNNSIVNYKLATQEYFVWHPNADSGDFNFSQPRGVYEQDGIVYIADVNNSLSSNNRIFMFAAKYRADLSNLMCSTAYNFRAYSNGIYGYNETFETLDCLSAPTGLTVIPSVSSVTLDWDNLEGANYYLVEYKESSSDIWSGQSNYAYGSYIAINGLSSGTSYDFRVRARSEIWHNDQWYTLNSEWTLPVSVTTLMPQQVTISDCEDLQSIAINPYTLEMAGSDAMSNDYIIESDIDCSETVDWDWSGLVPPEMMTANIGFMGLSDFDGDQPFSGSFDGKGYSINNLYQNATHIPYMGLFFMTDGARIENLTLDNQNITGSLIDFGSSDIQFSGTSLIALANNTVIDGVKIQNLNYKGRTASAFGAFIASSFDSIIVNSSVSGLVDATALDEYLEDGIESGGAIYGGLIGIAEPGSNTVISRSSFTGDIKLSIREGHDFIIAGGLAGGVGVTIDNSYFDGNIHLKGQDDPASMIMVGGLVGQMMGSINDSYSAGEIILDQLNDVSMGYVGGVVGLTYDIDSYSYDALFSTLSIQNYDSDSPITSGALIGGYLYLGSLDISNSYFDEYTTSQTSCVGVFMHEEMEVISQPGALGCSAVNSGNTSPDYFINNSINAPLNYWDFTNIWQTRVDGYPVHRTSPGGESGPTIGIPSGLSGSSHTLSVELDWHDVVGAIYYQVEYKLSSSSAWIRYNQVGNVTGSFVEVDGLDANTSYDFRVRAIGVNSLVGSWSSALTMSTLNRAVVYISSCRELQAISIDPVTYELGTDFNAHYVLTNDIDCTESRYYTWYAIAQPEIAQYFDGFMGILDIADSSPFTGSMDGQGHTIYNLSYSSNGGLFIATENAVIRNIKIKDASNNPVFMGPMFGALIISADNTDIRNVEIDNLSMYMPNGSVVGGLVGYANGTTTIQGSSATGHISAETYTPESMFGGSVFMGGLVGSSNAGSGTDPIKINKSYSDMTLDIKITSDGLDTSLRIGGLVGGLDQGSASISNSYALGSISAEFEEPHVGDIMVGGIISHGGEIMKSYSATDIDINVNGGRSASSSIAVGGLSGVTFGASEYAMTDAFYAGHMSLNDVSGNTFIGGVSGIMLVDDSVGVLVPQISNTYYDGAKNPGISCFAKFLSLDGNLFGFTGEEVAVNEGIDCNEINDSSYFIGNYSNPPLSSWDFNAIWRINSTKYPTFKVNETTNPNNPGDGSQTPGNGDGISPQNPGAGSGSPTRRNDTTRWPYRDLVVTAPDINDADNEQLPTGIINYDKSRDVELTSQNDKASARRMPKNIAVGLIFSVWVVLLALALLHIYVARNELARHRRFGLASMRFKQSVESSANFIRLVSHYLRTPLTKLNGALDLAKHEVFKAEVTPDGALSIIGNLENLLADLSKESESIISEANSIKQYNDVVEGSIRNVGLTSVIRQPEFWMPVSAIAVLTAMLHFMFQSAEIYDASILMVALVVLVGLVGIITLGVALYFRNRMRILTRADMLQNQADRELEAKKRSAIEGVYSDLSTYMDLIRKSVSNTKVLPISESSRSVMNSGVDDLDYLIKKMNIFVEFSKSVPGLVWDTKIAKVAADVMQSSDIVIPAEKDIEVVYSAIPTSSINIELEKITYVLKALIKNAIQAIPEKGIVKLDIVDKSDVVDFIVSDNGTGMPKAVLESIGSFFNKSSEEVMNSTGIGLDLGLAYGIVKQYGGSLEVVSSDSSGTVVRMTLPKV